MKIRIVGNGVFGSFLKELLAPHFEICDDAESVILAIPISAYPSWGAQLSDRHLINVCSVQKPSTDMLLSSTDRVTSIHPLFGRRTPETKRNSILTYMGTDNDTWDSGLDCQFEFIQIFRDVSKIIDTDNEGKKFTPESHDILMSKTHVVAVMAAKQLKVFVDRVKDVPDELIPHSFRMMREFVKTLDDMPQGTIESIMANPYF